MKNSSHASKVAVIIVVTIVVTAAFTFERNLDRGHVMAANHASAIGMVRNISDAEAGYWKQHHTYSCDPLALLDVQPDDPEKPHSFDFMVKDDGRRMGYLFAVRNCTRASNGVTTTYEVIAVPLDPGKSGVLAFCSDQSGTIYYDRSSTAETCLTKKNPLN